MRRSAGILLVLLTACTAAPATDPTADPTGHLPGVIARLVADAGAPTDDVVEVWICDVPADSTAERYGGLEPRLDLTAVGVVDLIGDPVAEHFAALSHGAYRPRFVAGGVVAMSTTDTDVDCVDAALARSASTSLAVLAVANAEHAPGQSGGWGTPGASLTCGTCPASATGRAAAVGASDFQPERDDTPLFDLVEHELGHTLGLPHSGTGVAGDDEYRSALDLMSNSAAPRDVDPGRRHGPSTLAVNLLDLGWLPLDDVVVIEPAPGEPAPTTVELAPATSADGTRLVVLAVDDHRVMTVEYRTNDGPDDHLPTSGIAIHAVDDRGGTDVLRVQLPVHTDTEPFTDLLQPGDDLLLAGWRIEVGQVRAGRISVTITASAAPTAG